MIRVELTPKEADVIRMALRSARDRHKRDGFEVLVIEADNLRSKISNAVIDEKLSIGYTK
jgi:hypothetical protein